jgi:hypothetical protein
MAVLLREAVDGLLSLQEGSVDLLLSDLPSGETRASFDRKPDLARLWPAIWHGLKPSGVVVLLAHSFGFAADIRSSQLDAFRYDLIWHKSRATGHLNASHRPLRAHEFILVFSLQRGVYHPQMLQGCTPIHKARRLSNGENYGRSSIESLARTRAGATDRYPTSVLEVASLGTSSRERAHPQQKPVPLMQWLVETYSSPGDLVVDPYAGSGSTEVAALRAGRRCLCFDDSPRFATS